MLSGDMGDILHISFCEDEVYYHFDTTPYHINENLKKKSFLKPAHKTLQFHPSLEALTRDMPLNHSKLSHMKKIDIPVGKYTIKKSLQKPAHRDLTFSPSLEGGRVISPPQAPPSEK